MRWVVGPEDGHTVQQILDRAAADPNALREGRVFLGRRRVLQGTSRVQRGDVVEVAAPARPDDGLVRIALMDDDLIAAEKPAGIPTIPDHGGSAHSLSAIVARLAGVAHSELHATSRLDRDVSGVVVFARTREAARRLASARSEGAYERRYVALSGSAPSPDRGTWDAPIGRASDPRRRAVGGRDAAAAVTRYLVQSRARSGAALLALSPVTGRTHQIRVHAAHAGAPLLGDKPYGGPRRFALPSGRVIELKRVALHAARVVVPDARGRPRQVTAPVPDDLVELWSDCGGDGTAWEAAARCALP